jgi:hypothetical protein
MLEQSLIIGEPTLNSLRLEKQQQQDSKLEQNKTIKPTRQRTSYIQDFNNINDEVYIHNILNPS